MNKKQKQILLLIVLVVLLITINYYFIDNYLKEIYSNINKEDFHVKRVIDGDTLIVGNNTSVRLFGINSPEKGELFYEEAKEFLEYLVLNKTIFIESFGKDKYYRELGVLFSDNENVNKKLIENGLANVYILDNKKYEKEFREAWEECVEENINLCEKSLKVCSECIKVKEFIGQEIVFENVCNFDCDLTGWSIKDEGRKKFIFGETQLNRKDEIKITSNYFEEDYVWTSTGDTLFLRDGEGKLVLFEGYNL